MKWTGNDQYFLYSIFKWSENDLETGIILHFWCEYGFNGWCLFYMKLLLISINYIYVLEGKYPKFVHQSIVHRNL